MSPTQYAYQQLGRSLAQSLDERLAQAITKHLGAFAMGDLVGRLWVIPSGDGGSSYLLDGAPLLRAYPPSIDRDGMLLTASQRFES